MEDELRCPACKRLFREPILLSCGHALCRSCAAALQAPAPAAEQDGASSGSGDFSEADKVSVASETDSGVVCGSRPGSYAGTPHAPSYPAPALSLTCPTCGRRQELDENGAEGLPAFRCMRNIVQKFGGTPALPPAAEEACQMCEEEKFAAVVRCEQCSVRYCAACRDAWHPTRGPLAQHELRSLGAMCAEHGTLCAVYCIPCRIPACDTCMHLAHQHHETRPLPSAARAQKTELSQTLQHLSEQAKAMTEYIQLIKSSTEKIDEACEELESDIARQCAAVCAEVERRRDTLVRAARGRRVRALADTRARADHATQRLHSAAALLHFSIEALKESDSAAFLQVGHILMARARDTAAALCTGLEPPPAAPDLTLDTEPVVRTVRNMNFVECTPPGAPEMAVEACCARGCSATLAWRAPPSPAPVRGYVLELDDGLGGPFREVYCGRETVCTVDGLHYASLYSARVKAFNGAGEGAYSEVIGLQTAPVAWFGWDARCGEGAGGGLRLEAGGLRAAAAAAAAGWEHRVALGDAPLARGVHYWQLRIDEYDGDADPAFGVARADVATDKMLGSDALGWAMYIDSQRSWFVHGGAHGGRAAGGVRRGATVGVLLDLTRGTLSFTVDGRRQGGVAFTAMRGTFYPAVSLNRGVAVTLQPALPPPELESDADSDVEPPAPSPPPLHQLSLQQP